MDIFGKDVILMDILFGTALLMPGLWYIYRKDRMFRGKSEWGCRIMLRLAVLGAGVSIAFRVLFEVFGMPGYESVEENLLSGNPFLQVIVLVAVSPILEEFFFRGVLYERLKRLIKPMPAMLITALGFGLYHGNISQGIYGFFMGVILAWCMEHFQTVKAPIAVHMAANLAAMCLEWLVY